MKKINVISTFLGEDSFLVEDEVDVSNQEFEKILYYRAFGYKLEDLFEIEDMNEFYTRIYEQEWKEGKERVLNQYQGNNFEEWFLDHYSMSLSFAQ